MQAADGKMLPTPEVRVIVSPSLWNQSLNTYS